MGHSINAVIGKRSTLSKLIERLGPPDATEMPFDLVIVPLNEQRLDALAMSTEDSYHGFTYLTPKLASEIGRTLGSDPALYIETDYFGGIGAQGAALFENGALTWKGTVSNVGATKPPTWLDKIFGPRKHQPEQPEKSPISHGLARLGVRPSAEGDEFDSVGLVRFRSLEALGLDIED